MSYDIELIDPVTKEPVEPDETTSHARRNLCDGRNYPCASLNVTYNYGAIFRRVLGDGRNPHDLRQVWRRASSFWMAQPHSLEMTWTPTIGRRRKATQSALVQLSALARDATRCRVDWRLRA